MHALPLIYIVTIVFIAYNAKHNNIKIEEIKTDKISDFDIMFVEATFSAERIFYEKDNYTLKKSFLMTNIETGNDTNPYVELFLYEILLKNKEGRYPDLPEKMTTNGYLKIRPETKATHTCYLFYDNDTLFIIGYYGLYPPYESFDIDFFISYVKDNKKIPVID